MPKLRLKTSAEIVKIAESGRILAKALRLVSEQVRPGVLTSELDELAEEIIRQDGGSPSFKGYGKKPHQFPAALCVSINDVIVHGVPDRRTHLEEGDLVSLDLGVNYRGFFSDAAVTLAVGKVNTEAERLIRITREALQKAIEKAWPGNRIGDISYAIQKTAETAGFSVVRDLIGHGVGYAVHEDPAVPCYGELGTGLELEEGLVLAIEPMICAGDCAVISEPDAWPVRTADGSFAAHFEHTVAITKSGPRILTLE